MYSTTAILNIFSLCLFFIIFKTEANTYYFNVNKTNNGFMVYNRVNLNNSISNNYSSDVYLSELRNNVTHRKNASEVQTHPLLDPEWNYNWNNVTRRKLPAYISKFYESVSKAVTGPVRILFNTMSQNSTVIKFNLSNIDTNETISDAELHFYYSVEKNLHQKSLILRLYQMQNHYFNATSLINPDAHKLLNVIYVLQAESGWQVFKLTNSVQSWLKGRKDLVLLITVSKPNEDQFSLFKDKNKDVFRTFLILKPESSNSELSEKVMINSEPCRKHDLHIDFGQLNWMKFIIAPTEYNAFNCYGRCYNSKSFPNHIKVTSYVPEIGRKSLSCVPIEYSSLPIMFYDKNGDIVIKVYDEMIVSACGCR